MSAALRIDTLKFVRRLTEAGMARPVAEAIADGLGEADISELATRADLAALETATRADLAAHEAATRADLATLKADIKADINAVRLEAADNKAEMFRFMTLQAVAIVGLTVGLMKLLP